MIELSHSLIVAAPELLLAGGAMGLLMIGVFSAGRSTALLSWLAVGLLAGAALLVALTPANAVATAFGGLFIADGFSRFLKIVILLGAAAVTLISPAYLERERFDRFEFPVLIVLATLGMTLMVSANDLLALYVGLELQSLALYVLASFRRDDLRSTEAGLKYFVLGALSSGLLLYGISLVYGFTGTTAFAGIAAALGAQKGASLPLLFGLVFILSGLAFKISAVPFHMWTPDVYEGSPTPVTAFFAAAPKVAAIGLLMRVLFDAFGGVSDDWRQIIVFLSIASMVLGAVAAIVQTNIKRLLAYSSIGHVGYALIGVAAGDELGIRAVLVYMTIYVVMTVGAFLCVMAMRRESGPVETIADLGGLAQRQPRLAFCFAILMFSLAGIPLLAGFFGKLYIFLAAMEAGLLGLAIAGVLASVVGTYYYLRVIKVMYFDPQAEAFSDDTPLVERGVLALSAVLCSPVSFLYIAPLLDAANGAAKALLG